MARFIPSAFIASPSQIADGVITKPKLAFPPADLNISNTFTNPQTFYAADKSQIEVLRSTSPKQGGSLTTRDATGIIHLAANGYFDGTNWQRYNTSYALWVAQLSPSGDIFTLLRAPSGSNPATLTEIFKIKSDGRIVTPNMGATVIWHGDHTKSYGVEDWGAVAAITTSIPSALGRPGEFCGAAFYIGSNTLNAAAGVGIEIAGTNYYVLDIPAGSTGYFSSTYVWSVPSATTMLRWYLNTKSATSGSITIKMTAAVFR